MAPNGKPQSGAWAGYAATVCAWAFAVPSFYWAFGGTIALATIGQWAVQAASERDPYMVAILFVTAALKVLGGVLSLALVQEWGQALPRRLLVIVGWGSSLLLTLYGGVQFGAQALVVLDVVQAPTNADLPALYWHFYLWSPWFLVWGILLGLTVRHYTLSAGANRSGLEAVAAD